MPYSNDYFLGIDVGTTSVKAGLVDENGNGIAQTSQEYPTYSLGNAWVEQSADDWWNATTAAVSSLTKSYPTEAQHVRGISVSSQAPTLLGVGAQGNPVGRGLIWMDQRASDICSDELLPCEDYIHTFSGNRINPYYAMPKLLWQKKHQPEMYDATQMYLQINGWIVYKLTGEFSIDESSAALTQTLNIHTLQTEQPLFERFGLSLDKWPRVYHCDEIVGGVLPEVADIWGIPAGTPVVAGCIDGASAPLGLGAIHPGDVFEMSGQSSGIGVVTDQPKYHPNLCLMRHAVGGNIWFSKGSMSCSGGSLKWFRDHIDGGNVNFNDYNTMAEASAPGAGGVIFLPYLCGERAPLWDRTLRGVYFGFGNNTTKNDMVRAIMEGSAFALRTILDEFHDPSLHEKTILGTGGGYNSRIWSQIKSDILNAPIAVHQMSFDATLTGNAMLVRGALGYPELPPIDKRDDVLYTPNPALREFYEERYQFYRKVFQANWPLFHEGEV